MYVQHAYAFVLELRLFRDYSSSMDIPKATLSCFSVVLRVESAGVTCEQWGHLSEKSELGRGKPQNKTLSHKLGLLHRVLPDHPLRSTFIFLLIGNND